MRLRRGHILLVAGGAIILLGLAIFGYYSLLFTTKLLIQNNYSIGPANNVSIYRFINSQNASQGTYIVAIPQSPIRPAILKIASPSGALLVEKQIAQTLTMDTFPVAETGNYTLIVMNSSHNSTLQANIVFGDQRAIIESGLSVSPETLLLIFSLTLYTGVAIIIAGAIITILDRQRISKMKRFGDTSDLV